MTSREAHAVVAGYDFSNTRLLVDIGGSFFESIPNGGDTYILKDILHDWDDEQASCC